MDLQTYRSTGLPNGPTDLQTYRPTGLGLSGWTLPRVMLQTGRFVNGLSRLINITTGGIAGRVSVDPSNSRITR